MESRLQSRWHDVCARWDRGAGYGSLSNTERVWLNTRCLIDSIENGGLISYFYNSGADTLSDCLDALKRLGAQDVSKQVLRLCALFPGGVPETGDARNDVINSWSDDDPGIDATLEEIDERLMPMMSDLETRLTNFLRDAGVAT